MIGKLEKRPGNGFEMIFENTDFLVHFFFHLENADS